VSDKEFPCAAENLIELMRAGDLEALDRISRCYGDHLMAVGRRYCGDEELARDAIQDTMLAAGLKLGEFRGDGSLEGWLVRMVANFCRRMHRGRKNDPSLHVDVAKAEIGDDSSTPEEDAVRGELMAILSRALDVLSPNDRSLVLLADAEGWTAPEIAEEFDMTPGQVRTRLSRARRRLRDHLGPMGEMFDPE
jgi:RNA polymerase sigma-70 factor (ECF subfamily)